MQATSVNVTLEELTSCPANSHSRVAWRDSAVMVEALLGNAALVGEYTLRPVRKTRFATRNGANTGAFKVGHSDTLAVVLTIRPPGGTNGDAWEYRLTPPHGVSPALAWQALHALNGQTNGHVNGKQAVKPAEARSDQQKPVDLVERLKALQEASARSKARDAELAAIEAQRKVIAAEIKDLQDVIDNLDTQALTIMETQAADKDAAIATDALAALGKLLFQ